MRAPRISSACLAALLLSLTPAKGSSSDGRTSESHIGSEQGLLTQSLSPHAGPLSDSGDSTHSPLELDGKGILGFRAGCGTDPTYIAHAGLNFVFPGAGLLLDGEAAKGFGYGALGATLLGGALLAHLAEGETSLRNNLLLLYQNVTFISMWDGYTTSIRRECPGASRYKVPRPWHYMASPVSGEGLPSWECLIPTSIAGGIAAAYLSSEDEPGSPDLDHALGAEAVILGQSTLIGTGEELLFRGVLLPELNAWTGNELISITAQALIFAAGHLSPEADGEENTMRAGFTTAFGLYAGWVAVKRPHGLRKAIAMHAWWDALIFSADYLDDGRAEPIILTIGLDF